ncbi:MAG: PQQ-binding-like beta-propeller repeat protein [Chloroflexota bacterium]|nr:PQQ-binding-like beta-propeller repeat protein [Chloroflexota bacterium]
MKKNLFLILIVLVLALTLSSCSGRTLAASGWSGLMADEETAYLAAGSQIYAINLKNGSLKWAYPSEVEAKISFYADPVLTEDGQLIIGGYNGVLYSLDPANGTENWTYEKATSQYIGSPLVTSEGIFAPSADNNVYAVSLQGKELWEPFTTNDPVWAQPITIEGSDYIYVASMDHRIYAINSKTGAEVWKTGDLGGPIVSAPAIEDNVLYVSTFANEVLAINVETQSVLWRFETQDWAWASPVVDGDQLYVSDLAGGFYALDKESGEQLWQIIPGGEIVSAPLIVDESIYFGTSEGAFIVVNSEGTIQQNTPLDGKLYSHIIATENIILVAPSENEEALLIGFDPSGIQKWSFAPEK